jgi:serine phosphatase RsbU (regulator of sigma subunit)
MLYTDGVVETPGRDLAVGIDRLLGQAERLVTAGFRLGARLLVDRVATGESDDRALVLIWRS